LDHESRRYEGKGALTGGMGGESEALINNRLEWRDVKSRELGECEWEMLVDERMSIPGDP
jgi:hypothetical protein